MNDNLKKVITWRVLSFTIGSIISYLYLGEFKKSFELTIILTIIMTTVHYFYEQAWENNKART
tara:strand:+ start:719 stop:907 length:189 start_codon:yes stop_codon:yes gene_type:complete